MSGVYVTEPPTEGKVILHTTAGPLDIELWSKQTPLACRNFLQLCEEGYYNGTIFHRLVKDSFIQGGDPTGTGEGGESVYGEQFKDEYHSRLRFSHRGLVACASHGSRHSNRSQFFITLDQTPEFNGRHTIFGKVTGDSLFNLLPMNTLEIDEDDRPKRPPKVLRTEVVWDPMNVIPREKPKIIEEKVVAPKPKGIKNMSLLSFGKDEDEDEDEGPALKTKMVSRFVAIPPQQKRKRKFGEQQEEPAAPTEEEPPTKIQKTDAEDDGKKPAEAGDREKSSTKKSKKSEDDQDFDEMPGLAKLDGGGDVVMSEKNEDGEEDEDGEIQLRTSKKQKKKKAAPTLEEMLNVPLEEDERQKEIKRQKKALLRELRGKDNEDDDDANKNMTTAKAKLLASREKYKRNMRDHSSMDFVFNSFRNRLQDVKPGSEDWKTHALTFDEDEERKKDTHQVDEYVVYDPLQGRKKTDDEVSFNKHNLMLRAKKKLDEW